MAVQVKSFSEVTFIIGTNQFIVYNNTTGVLTAFGVGSGIAFSGGFVTNTLVTGLAAGQTVKGGVNPGENLTLTSTSDATKGRIYLGTSFNDYYNETNHHFVLFGTSGVVTQGAIWHDGNQKTYATYTNNIQKNLSGVVFVQTADKTVTNTVTQTSIVGTGVGTVTLPANFFVAGKTIRLRIGGVYSTPALSTPSVIVRVKYGSTVIATVTTSALLSGATNLEFDGKVDITCRTPGGVGTVITHGDVIYATGVAGTTAVDPLNNAGATTTIDTTTSNLLDVTIQWDTATTTRIVKATSCIVEVLN